MAAPRDEGTRVCGWSRAEGSPKSEIRPQAESRTVEILVVLERQIEATDHRHRKDRTRFR